MALFIYGKHPVEEALKAGRVTRILLQKDKEKSRIVQNFKREADKRRIPIEWIEEKQIVSRLGKVLHQGVIAKIRPLEFYAIEDLIEAASKVDRLDACVLAHLESPRNIGAIVRSAAAFGVNWLIIPSRRSGEIGAEAYKASAGILERIKLVVVSSIPDALKKLKNKGFWTYGAAGEGATSLPEVEFADKNVLVLGNEADGLPQLVRKTCDYLVSIPIDPGVESLNVSTAASVLLYKLAESRLSKKS